MLFGRLPAVVETTTLLAGLRTAPIEEVIYILYIIHTVHQRIGKRKQNQLSSRKRTFVVTQT